MQTLVKKYGACFATCCFLLCTQVTNSLQAGGVFGSSLNDVTVTEYDGIHFRASVHVTHVFVDHEKWGFFRVGLLPIAAVEGIQIQIPSASCLTNALSALNSLDLPSAGLRRLEYRDIQISLPGEKEPRLHAAIARVSPPGFMKLSNVSVAGDGGGTVSIPKATLQISGPGAGCLRWNDGGEEEELFVFKSLKNNP
jgi:hypothetical protein